MQPSLTCRSCLNDLRGFLIGSPTPIAYISIPKRGWSSSIRNRHAQLKARHRPRFGVSQTRASTSTSTGAQNQTNNNNTAESALPNSRPDLRAILTPDNLFHPFTKSPSPDMRQKAAVTMSQAYCPHPGHHLVFEPTTAFLEARKINCKPVQPPAHVRFECPDCGVPVYCTKEHWEDDYENHSEICDVLRQINEDEHDLRSGRLFSEFNLPGMQMDEALVNMSSWDTYLYTREHEAINSDRSMRQATRMLTYPVTIGSILHELSPYNIKKGGRLTVEGLKSLTALRYTLHPILDGSGEGIKGLRPKAPPVRIFILGARAESSLPRDAWHQLAFLFPLSKIHLILIGPESMTNRDSEFPLPKRTAANPFGAVVEDRISPMMKITTFVEYYHTLHEARLFQPFDAYFDCFVLFHPGLGHPASSHEWEQTIPQLLETKCPILCTGYTEWDMNRDRKWVEKTMGGEVDLLMEPGENKFRSLRWDLNDLDPGDISCGNWGVWAFRGKRYEATMQD